MILCTCHPSIRPRLRHRSKLIWLQLLQEVLLPPQNTHMRPKELVSRAGKKIAAPLRYVNRSVRRIVNCIEKNLSADLVRRGYDALNIVDCADRVRGASNGHEPRAFIKLTVQIVEIESAIIWVYI